MSQHKLNFAKPLRSDVVGKMFGPDMHGAVYFADSVEPNPETGGSTVYYITGYEWFSRTAGLNEVQRED